MAKCIAAAAALLSALSFLAVFSCTESNIAVVTPVNTYSKEDILGKAEDYCKKYGMLPAEVKADQEIWNRLIDDVVREFVYADLGLINVEVIDTEAEIEISEKDIQDKYKTLLLSQRKYFSDKKEIVSAAITYPRDTILYYPEGLKWVKTFTVPFESEVRGRAAILLSEGKYGDYEELVASAENSMAPLIQELRQKLAGGAGFDDLAAEYSAAGYDDKEKLLYDEDSDLFAAQLAAVKTLKETGDIAEYNIYQGHVFMIFVRTPDYIEVPYEVARDGIEASIKEARTVIQRDLKMRKLYAEAVGNGSVKIKTKGI
jgi:hypothetical protein